MQIDSNPCARAIPSKIRRRSLGGLAAAGLLSMSVACGHDLGDQEIDVDLLGGSDGPADMASGARLLDDLALDSVVVGTFDPNVRVYGYTLDAAAGAEIRVSLEAHAGDDAHDLPPGEVLNTALAIYGPYEGAHRPGQELAKSTHSGDSVAAGPVTHTVEEDGTYLVAFQSFDDTGTGEYELEVGCDGSDSQCRRVEFPNECRPGTLYVQGGAINEDTTWDHCEVVVLQSTTLAADAALAIDPGVKVLGNYIARDGDEDFGDVKLIAEGALHIRGDVNSPVIFRGFTDRGWGGIVLHGDDNRIEHARIRDANTAVKVARGAEATIEDSILTGRLADDSTGAHGVLSRSGERVVVRGTAIRGFQNGVELNAYWQSEDTHLVVEDSVIRDNHTGVFLRGRFASNTASGCGRTDSAESATFLTEIRHTDIFDNGGSGIFLRNSYLMLDADKLNVIDNNFALRQRYHVESRPIALTGSNILHNDSQPSVRSQQRSRPVDISHNYWGVLSDPELSENWTTCSDNYQLDGIAPAFIESAGPRSDIVDAVKALRYGAD